MYFVIVISGLIHKCLRFLNCRLYYVYDIDASFANEYDMLQKWTHDDTLQQEAVRVQICRL